MSRHLELDGVPRGQPSAPMMQYEALGERLSATRRAPACPMVPVGLYHRERKRKVVHHIVPAPPWV